MAAAIAKACGSGRPSEEVEAELLCEMRTLDDRDEALDFSMVPQLEIGLAEKFARDSAPAATWNPRMCKSRGRRPKTSLSISKRG